MIEPLSVVVHAIRHAGVSPTDDAGKVAVAGGAGPIGLLAAAVLRAYGLTTIVSEVSAERRAKAEQSGVADVAVDPASQDLTEVVREQTGGAMADYAFDEAGVPVVLDQLFDVLGPGARLEVVALHTKPYELDVTARLTMQDRVLGSAVGYDDDHPEVIRLVQEGLVDLEPFITSRIVVDDIIEQGFEKLLDDRSEVVLGLDDVVSALPVVGQVAGARRGRGKSSSS